MAGKKILVIGNEIVVNNVAGLLYPDAIGVYDVVSWVQSQGGGVVDWSSDAVTRVIQQHGENYSAIVVDLGEQHAAQAARDAGFKDKPIIGIGSHPSDQIPGADRVLAFHICMDKLLLRKTLDELVK